MKGKPLSEVLKNESLEGESLDEILKGLSDFSKGFNRGIKASYIERPEGQFYLHCQCQRKDLAYALESINVISMIKHDDPEKYVCHSCEQDI